MLRVIPHCFGTNIYSVKLQDILGCESQLTCNIPGESFRSEASQLELGETFLLIEEIISQDKLKIYYRVSFSVLATLAGIRPTVRSFNRTLVANFSH